MSTTVQTHIIITNSYIQITQLHSNYIHNIQFKQNYILIGWFFICPHEEPTLVVPFGGHIPPDGAALWQMVRHRDRLSISILCGLSNFA